MKIKFSIFLLIFFVSANINANIPRDSVSNVKQLTWNDIVLQLSGTYAFTTEIFEDEDGSIYFYPAQEKFGALGAFNNTGISFSKEYLYRIPKFNNIQGMADFQGHDEEGGWGVYKTDNTICYSSEIDTILNSCVYLFEGFENGKKYIYFSETKNSDFYSRINKILKISNEITFNEWSRSSLEQQALNIKNIRNYNDKKIAGAGAGAKFYPIDNESMKHFFDSFGERRVYDYYENNDWERFKAIMDGSRSTTMGQGRSLSSFYNQYLNHDGNKAIAINTNRSPNAGQNYYKSTKLDGLCLSFGYGSSQEKNEKGALDCCYMETQSEGGEKICVLLFSGDRIVNKDYIGLLHTDTLYQAKIKRNQEKEEKRIADAKKAEEEADKKHTKKHAPIAQQITQIAEGNYSSLLDGSFVKNPNNLSICQPSLQEIDFDTQVWDNCWGIQTWSGKTQSQQCVGNCPITRVFEGEYHNFKWSGLGINYYPESIWITIMKNGGWGKNAWGIEGWGFEQRSECKLLGSKVVDGKWVDSEKTDCPGIRELSAIFPTFDCTKSYPFKCDLNVSENFLTTPIGKEYVATSSASVREQPFNDSKLVKTIPKGTTVFVISKTETNDWYLIKEIRDNGFGEDIGQKLGYSPVEFFLSRDEITSNNNSTYSDSPGNLLINAYVGYMVIKNMHSMREGYVVVYINDSQMKKVRNQMIEIEKILVNKFSLDEDLLWDTAMSKYDQDYSMIDLFESTGIYTEDGNRLAMIALLGFDTIADEVLESSPTKDF